MQMECRRQLLQGEPPPPAEEAEQGQGDLGWSEGRRSLTGEGGWGMGTAPQVQTLSRDPGRGALLV